MQTFPVKIKINTPLRGYKAGKILTVQADEYGVLTDSYWRRRLKDSKNDNCIEMIVSISSNEKTKKPEIKTENKSASL